MGINALTWICSALFLMSALLSVAAGFATRKLRRKDARLVAEGVVTNARVVEEVDTGGDGFDYRLAYRVGSNDYAIVTQAQAPATVGDVVQVRYHPERPQWARREIHGELWRDSQEPLMFLFLGVAASIVFFAASVLTVVFNAWL